MRVTLSPAERAIIEATLSLANRKESPYSLLRLVKQSLASGGIKIESLLSISAAPPADVRAQALADPKHGREYAVAIEDDAAINELVQSWKAVDRVHAAVDYYRQLLRDWLTKIAIQGTAAYPKVVPQVSRYLHLNALRPGLEDGRVVYILGVNIVPGLLAYGTALILDRKRGLAERLGRCGYCGRFNLTFEGRPKTHCSEAHRLKYDRKMAAERMREYRKRKQRRDHQ